MGRARLREREMLGPGRPHHRALVGAALVPDDLDYPAPFALAVQLDEEHALPGPEGQLALAHGDRLAGGAEQHRHAVRVSVADVHVLRTDVLRALVPIVVRVISLDRYEPSQQLREVLEEARLELVHAHAARGVRGVHARDAFLDATLPDRLRDLVGDVADAEAPGRPQLRLALEDLHGRLL